MTAVHDDEPPYEDPYDVVTPIRPPAHANTPAEHALIATLIAEPARAPHLLDQVAPDDFYEPRHETIWHAVEQILANGLLPDHATLLGHLSTNGNLAGIQLTDYTLSSTGAIPSQADHYAHTIRNAAIVRRAKTAITAAHRHIDTATTPEQIDDALAGVLDAAENGLRTLWSNGTRTATGPAYVTFDGLFTRPRTPIQWVIAPLLAAGRVTLLYSPGKTGKSLIAMEAAAAIASGRAALATEKPTDPAHVLYIDQEMTEDDWIDRLADMGYTTTDEQLLAEHLHLAQLQTWPPMDTAAGGLAVERAAKHTAATTVIIDTASKVIAGEENSNDTQQAFYRHTLVPLKRAGIAVLVLDHTGKDIDRGARGGSAKTDNIDLAFELIRRGKDLLTMRCTHARVRDDLLEEPTYLRRVAAPLTHRIEHLGTSAEAAASVRPTHLMERVSRYVEVNPGQSKTSIETAVKGRVEYVRLALELLVAEQYIRVERGARNTMTHHHVKPFREDDGTDDN